MEETMNFKENTFMLTLEEKISKRDEHIKMLEQEIIHLLLKLKNSEEEKDRLEEESSV